MNKLEEIRCYLDMNEEVEFRYKGLECFITQIVLFGSFGLMMNVSLKGARFRHFLMIPCLEDHTIR